MTRFLALGDSYTVGEAVDSMECWPALLVDLLRREALAVADPTIVARTGWTIEELAAGIDAAGLEGEYGLVMLLIGVNNQYRGWSPEEYESHFRDLLLRAIQFAGGEPSRVIVLSIPDWSVTPFADGRDRAAIAAGIDQFSAINKRESHRLGAHCVDVTVISREAADNDALLAGDGLHPSAEMYKRWVQAVAPIARNILSRDYPREA